MSDENMEKKTLGVTQLKCPNKPDRGNPPFSELTSKDQP
jgi:hypothetical protein